jgi:arsenate reductase (thioredoxin)
MDALVRSKSWEEFARGAAPKPMTAHWGLPDPVQAEGSKAERHLAFADTLRMLSNRIGIFVSLPLDRLSKPSLQAKAPASLASKPA